MVDRLPEGSLGNARDALAMVGSAPILTRIGEEPPLDDEPVTDDDLAAMREAEERGEYVSLSELRERYASSR